MPIHYRCPSCDQLLSITTRKAGHEVPCPQCGAITVVPLADEPAESGLLPAIEEPVDREIFVVKGTAPATPLAAVPDALEPPTEPVEDLSEEHVVTSHEESFVNDLADDDAGGFQLRRSNPELGELDLTSMVDVTFLLLIFFMVTASFSLQKTIEIPAPKQDQKGAAQTLTIEELQSNTIFVKIDERNGIFVDDVPSGDPSKLTDTLTQARLTTLRTEVAIDAHPEALHETVVLVIDAATAAGMQKVRIVSRTGSGE
ncbi:MAG: Biopolymer transport protein ExbD/TolR [Planctomycetaceae bacterium]|nr:Biopolymer transport protein ExbD/TolR [Planctomycetaceae bacterium]